MYTAIYDLDPASGAWLVHIDGVEGCTARGRTIELGRRRIREALAGHVDDAANAEIHDKVRLPKDASKALRGAKESREAAAKAAAAADAATREAIATLRTAHVPARDIAALLGISWERVARLETGGAK